MRYILEYVDEMVTVSDDEILKTMFLLLERAKEIVEPSGAAAAAYAISKRMKYRDKNIAIVLSGGNVDVSTIHDIIENGLTWREDE
jgi:threonine dehydratase